MINEHNSIIFRVAKEHAVQHFSFDMHRQIIKFMQFKKQGGFLFGNLTLLHYWMFGGNSEDIYKVAAAIELAILSLDIFDDLQDQDNNEVPWAYMDNALAMNIAIGLIPLSIAIIEASTFSQRIKLQAISLFNSRIIQAVKGQNIDLLNCVDSEEECLEMIRLKSGSLVSLACEIGTVLSSPEYLDTVKSYAQHIGIAAQIQNDLRGIESVKRGTKNDILEKKMTLPVLYLLKNDSSETQPIRDYYFLNKDKKLFIQKYAHLLDNIVLTSGALEYASIIRKMNQFEATELIRVLPVSQSWKNRLIKYI